MSAVWEARLRRWVDAGLLEPAAADRIRAWELSRAGAPAARGAETRWPVRLALGLGGLLLCAGLLLFVAAHWDMLAPGTRFGLVLGTVAAFHLLGAASSEWSPALATTLHACGTVALGGGIFLSGQIFHLQEHWPAGLMLWALGAGIGWLLLRSWPQAALGALLTPAWLTGEWSAATERHHGEAVLSAGLLLLALVYLGARPSPHGPAGPTRRALAWIGGLGTIPAALFVVAAAHGWRGAGDLPTALFAAGALVALAGPLALAWAMRGRIPPALAGLAAWTAAGPVLAAERGVVPYLWAAMLSLGLTGWGVLERRAERINLGLAGFALTVLVFYFSSVMDRLGRSASLIGLGLLFLGGGWALERGRRRLIAQVAEPDS